jgi:hypothetical protein
MVAMLWRLSADSRARRFGIMSVIAQEIVRRAGPVAPFNEAASIKA